MVDFVEIIASIFWIGVSLYSVYFLELMTVFQASLHYFSMQLAIGTFLVVLFQGFKVVYVIPKREKVPQITPDNYEQYALKEIQTAAICGVVSMFSLFIAWWPHLHIITPLLLVLYFMGLVNILKWF